MQGFGSQATTRVATRKCGVLIADDEPDIREVLADGLERTGFSVCLAADGQEALELYRSRSETIDVVLLDVLMPRLDGPRTLAALQELTPQIPCCFMSGGLGAYTAAELRTQGARALLEKPFSLTQVVQLLRSVVTSVSLSAIGDPLRLPRSTAGTWKRTLP